jgi:hypothetical protein
MGSALVNPKLLREFLNQFHKTQPGIRPRIPEVRPYPLYTRASDLLTSVSHRWIKVGVLLLLILRLCPLFFNLLLSLAEPALNMAGRALKFAFRFEVPVTREIAGRFLKPTLNFSACALRNVLRAWFHKETYLQNTYRPWGAAPL